MQCPDGALILVLLPVGYQVMRANDQLIREREKGTVFKKYREGLLQFPPTYKYDKQSDT